MYFKETSLNAFLPIWDETGMPVVIWRYTLASGIHLNDK